MSRNPRQGLALVLVSARVERFFVLAFFLAGVWVLVSFLFFSSSFLVYGMDGANNTWLCVTDNFFYDFLGVEQCTFIDLMTFFIFSHRNCGGHVWKL